MLYKAIRNLGYVNQPVVMNAYIHKRAEINDVADGAGKLHTLLKIVYIHKVGPELRRRKFRTYIAARLENFLYYIAQRHFSDIQLGGDAALSVGFYFAFQLSQF